MSKKTASSTQVRLSPEMAVRVDDLREKYEARISRSAFVELLIERGIMITKHNNANFDTAERTLKK